MLTLSSRELSLPSGSWLSKHEHALFLPTTPLLSNICAEKHVLECIHLGFLWWKILAIQSRWEVFFSCWAFLYSLRMYFFFVLNYSILENRANNFVVTKVSTKYSWGTILRLVVDSLRAFHLLFPVSLLPLPSFSRVAIASNEPICIITASLFQSHLLSRLFLQKFPVIYLSFNLLSNSYPSIPFQSSLSYVLFIINFCILFFYLANDHDCGSIVSCHWTSNQLLKSVCHDHSSARATSNYLWSRDLCGLGDISNIYYSYMNPIWRSCK